MFVVGMEELADDALFDDGFCGCVRCFRNSWLLDFRFVRDSFVEVEMC